MQDVAIFWDYENCPASANASGYTIVNNIRCLAQSYGSIKTLKAYLGITEQSSSRTVSLRSELQSSGVSLIDCPHNGRKDVADKMIIVDMLAYAIDNPAPSTLVLISGDQDFAYALSILRLRRYQVVLVTLPNAHPSLTSQASIRFDWLNDILDVQKPPPGTNISESHPERSRPASFREKPSHVPSHSTGQVDFDGDNEESSDPLQCSPKKEQPKPPLVFDGNSASTGLENIRNIKTYVGVSSQNNQPPNFNPSYSHPLPQNTKFQSPPTNTSINDVGLDVGAPDTRNAEDFVSSTICALENSSVEGQTDNDVFLFEENFGTSLMSPSMRRASAPSLLPSPPPITDDVVSALTTSVNDPLCPIPAITNDVVSTLIAPINDPLCPIPAITDDAVSTLTTSVNQPLCLIPAITDDAVSTLTTSANQPLCPIPAITDDVVSTLTTSANQPPCPVPAITDDAASTLTASVNDPLCPIPAIIDDAVSTSTTPANQPLCPIPAITDDVVSTLTTPANQSLCPIPAITDDVVSTLTTRVNPLLCPIPAIIDDVVPTLTTPVNHPLGPIPVIPITAAAFPLSTIADWEQVHPGRGSTTTSSSSAPSVPPMFKVLVNILQARRLKGDLRPLRSVVGEELSKSNVSYKTGDIKKFSQYSALAERKGIVQLGSDSGRVWIALKSPFHNVSCT